MLTHMLVCVRMDNMFKFWIDKERFTDYYMNQMLCVLKLSILQILGFLVNKKGINNIIFSSRKKRAKAMNIFLSILELNQLEIEAESSNYDLGSAKRYFGVMSNY